MCSSVPTTDAEYRGDIRRSYTGRTRVKEQGETMRRCSQSIYRRTSRRKTDAYLRRARIPGFLHGVINISTSSAQPQSSSLSPYRGRATELQFDIRAFCHLGGGDVPSREVSRARNDGTRLYAMHGTQRRKMKQGPVCIKICYG